MIKFSIEILQRAVFEMNEIYRYICEDNQSAANKVFDDIQKAIENLAIFPEKGSPLDSKDDTMKGWRYVVVNPYLVFYKVNGNTVTVCHILDGGRDYLKILTDK